MYATTMDKRSWQPKKMRNDSTQVFRIDRPSLKDLLFPLIKANGYCHNYIRNNGRNNNGQQKFATEEDEKRFDPLSTVSSNSPPFSSLIFPRFIFSTHKGTDCSRALLPRERFLSYRSIVRPWPGPYPYLSPPSRSFFKTCCCSFQAGWLALYTYIALPRHASLHPWFVSSHFFFSFSFPPIVHNISPLCMLARLSSNKNKISSCKEEDIHIYIYSPREKFSFFLQIWETRNERED